MQLNLTPQNKQEELILNYLQNNASESLADKINNGTPFEKDRHPLLNKKTLSGFMKYACDEARKLAEKGANSACIDDVTVYGWAIHYFEEDSIEGTLYTIDGEEYKPAPKKVASTKSATVKPQPPKPQNLQFSIFDKIDDTEVEDTKTNTLTTETDTNDDETDMPTEEERQEILAQVHEEEQRKKGNPTYQKYMELQDKYPTAIVAYRLGDFYEIFGENAKIVSDELNLTLTGRDCGLEARVPMVGFPYHVRDNYLNKILTNHDVYIYDSEDMNRFFKKVTFDEMPDIDEETGEILSEEEMRLFDGDIEEPDDILAAEKELAKGFEPTAVCKLEEMLGDVFIVR